MACFTVPLAEVIITSVVQKVIEKNEKKSEVVWNSENNATEKSGTLQMGYNWSQKLSWLNKMLWGGVILLAFEHLWHGEIVPWPPFLTAMNNPADIGPMLHEIATIGTGMAVFTTVVWALMVVVIDQKTKNIPIIARSNA